MDKTPDSAELMTMLEAGDALGVSVRTLQLWIDAGVLPVRRNESGALRIVRSATEALRVARDRVIAQPPQPLGVGVAGLRTLKLLLVEDDPIQQQLFALMADKWDFPVQLTLAADGFEALLRVGQIRPDLLVTDLRMPSLDGFQMVRALKAQGSGFEDLTVVVVSSYSNGDIYEHGGLPEDILVFHKPLDFGQIEALARLQAQRSSR